MNYKYISEKKLSFSLAVLALLFLFAGCDFGSIPLHLNLVTFNQFPSPPESTGQTFYIRSGAGGADDGSDWTNAFPTMPASLERDATYYIADGSYGAYTFDDAADGTDYIVLKKATIADHGTSAGWSNAYGDGQAEFTRWNLYAPGLLIDGQVGTGNGSVEQHGIKVHYTMDGNAVEIRHDDERAGHNLHIRHVEIEHAGTDRVGFNNADAIYLLGWDGQSVGYVYFSDCYVHDVTRTLISARNSQYIEFDGCFFERCQNDVGIHGEGVAWNTTYGSNQQIIPLNLVWRNCVFKDIEGAGVIVIGLQHNADGRWHSDITITGNVFWSTSSLYRVTDGIICALTDNALSNTYVHNNTFVSMYGPYSRLAIFTGDFTSDNYAYNNIIYDFDTPAIWRDINVDYNWYLNDDPSLVEDHGEAHGEASSAHPFVNAGAGDFRLTTASPAGRILSPTFSEDPDGVQRGTDGTWDRGAYEY